MKVKATIEITKTSYAHVGSGRSERSFRLSVGNTLLCQGKVYEGGRSLETGMPVINQGWKLGSVSGIATKLEGGVIRAISNTNGQGEVEIDVSEQLWETIHATA